MSTLGYYDIINELGRNILIYPLDNLIIKGASIDLTVSKYAWSLNSEKSLVDGDDVVIPPLETAIIFTNETIWASEKICGTYHPKVSLVSRGLTHIATTLDPLFVGISKITLTNLSDNEIRLPINSPFVSIILHYIKSSSKNTENITSKEFITDLNHFQNYQSFYNWVQNNNWIFEYKELRNKMISCQEYKDIKSLQKYHNKFKSLINNPYTLPLFTIIVIVFACILSIKFEIFDMTSTALLPLAVYCLIEIIKIYNE